MLAQLTLRFRKTAHCHPRNNRLGEGEGNQTASTGVEELSHLCNLTLVQHITCAGVRHKTARTAITEKCPAKRHVPGLVGHSQLQAPGLELRFLVCSNPLMFSIQKLACFNVLLDSPL